SAADGTRSSSARRRTGRRPRAYALVLDPPAAGPGRRARLEDAPAVRPRRPLAAPARRSTRPQLPAPAPRISRLPRRPLVPLHPPLFLLRSRVRLRLPQDASLRQRQPARGAIFP